jgi:alpha-ketoglutarate-dependent taurine dioxygenase
MSGVQRRLSSEDHLTLSQTRYRSPREVPTILRSCSGRAVFAFRDFLGQPLEWVCTRPDATAASVNEALRHLLAAVYAGEQAQAVHWRRGMLIIIDNTFYFHGRTASMGPAKEPRRHLQRLRILPA